MALTVRDAAVGFNVTPVTAIALTEILEVAIKPPSCVVAVMLAVPAATAVTNPLAFTVATAVLLLFQVTVLLLAFAGATVAVNCCVPLMKRLADVGLTDTPVTAIGMAVTRQVAVMPPSCVVTVMVAVPAVNAVTNPVEFTVATAVLLLLQVTDWLLAFAGAIVAANCCVLFMGNIADVGATVTPVTATAVETANVAACKATLPVPEACTHFTVSNLPAEAALYVNV